MFGVSMPVVRMVLVRDVVIGAFVLAVGVLAVVVCSVRSCWIGCVLVHVLVPVMRQRRPRRHGPEPSCRILKLGPMERSSSGLRCPAMDARRRLRIICAALAGCAVLAACDRAAPGPQQIQLRPDDPQVLQLGQKVYATHCAQCHGVKLQGQPNWRDRNASGRLPAPPHDPSGHTWHHPDAQLFALTKYGVAKVANLKDYQTSMPAYEGVLSDAEIVAVLSWIKAQWPAEVRAKHDRINQAAREQR